MALSSSVNFRNGGRRPRVGVDFHTFTGIFQGSRSHVLGIFREAVQLALEIDFVFFVENPSGLTSAYAEFVAPNVRVVHLPHQPGLIRLGFQLPWLQYREKLDLLHTQYRIPFVQFGPCACTIHDVLFESHPEYFPKFFTIQSKFTFRLAARFARMLFTVSEFSRDEISTRFGLDPGQLHVLYNGVDRTRFFPGREGEEMLVPFGLEAGGYLLTVGRLEPRKNHARLIEAYAQLGENTPPLVCIGQRDFGYAAALEAASRFGVQERVRFLENIGDDVMPALMRNARVFLFPAIAEGFGMPVAEALASGVPVVTSCTTSLPEVAGNAAVLIDPLDVASISQGIEKVLGDPALAARMVVAGQEHVRKFDWVQSAGRLVECYRTFFANQSAGLLAHAKARS